MAAGTGYALGATAGNYAQTEAAPETAMSRLQDLGNSVGQLGECIDSLRVKLGPILKPDAPTPTDSNAKGAAARMTSNLSDGINAVHQRVSQLQESVRSMERLADL
jgi:hypothetical protein